MPLSSLKNPDSRLLREHILTALTHLEAALSEQGFLNGFKHLPFEEAVSAFEALTGLNGYLSERQSRGLYHQGRIDDSDLSAALDRYPGLQAEQLLFNVNGQAVRRADIYRVALLFDLSALSVSQLSRQIDGLDALGSVQADVPEPVRRRLLAAESQAERPASSCIRQLWSHILTKLNLDEACIHPEMMFDLSPEQAEDWWLQAHSGEAGEGGIYSDRLAHEQTRQQAARSLTALLAQVGEGMTLRGVILTLSGTDILDSVRPQLIRAWAFAPDAGIAAWPVPEGNTQGWYAAWRDLMRYDAHSFLDEVSDWQQIISELPDDAVSALILHLGKLDIPQAQWQGYLHRLILELPNCPVLIHWQEHCRSRQTAEGIYPKLADYLAIRLTLDRLWLNQVCRQLWKIEARLSSLRHYFHKNLSEFMVRQQLYQGNLPEYLVHSAESLIIRAGSERQYRSDWQQLADFIRTWERCRMPEHNSRHTIENSGWRLFRLCQHIGLGPDSVQQLQQTDLYLMLGVLDAFTVTDRSKIWLSACEHHYRERFFQALCANYARSNRIVRRKPPEAQIIFAMNEPAPDFRRYLATFNPAFETLGITGFGLSLNCRRWTDIEAPLCPEAARKRYQRPKNGEETFFMQRIRPRFYQQFSYRLYQNHRGNLLLKAVVIDLLAPFILALLLVQTFLSVPVRMFARRIMQVIVRKIAAELPLADTRDRSAPARNFTDNEQADKVADFLRAIDLTERYAPIICLIGHGSNSQNIYQAASDADTCDNRQDAVSVRLLAAMANRSEVRALLAQRGILIPPDCWWLGAHYDTLSGALVWYDLEALPSRLKPVFKRFKTTLLKARDAAVHERSQRFFSADNSASDVTALFPVQPFPGLNPVPCAAVIIGRRTAGQGLFPDGQVFLIVYDAQHDRDGHILENILLIAVTGLAGISLENYFSTVNNDCSTPIGPNITGFFGARESARSDLHTGLPGQIAGTHEAMRLQILVEAETFVLEQIYSRQESLRQLIGGGWVHLSTVDPNSGDIYRFEPGTGFVRRQVKSKDLPLCEPLLNDCGDRAQNGGGRVSRSEQSPG